MNRQQTLVRLLAPLALAVLAQQVRAQVANTLPTRGNLSGQEVGFIVGYEHEIVRKRAGLPNDLHRYSEAATSYAPRYSIVDIEAVLQTINNGVPVTIEPDSVSSGNDLLPFPASPTNNIVVIDPRTTSGAPLGWGALFLTVAENAQVPDDTYLGSLNPADRGSEIIGYYFDGSALPPQMNGNTFLEQSREMGDFTAGGSVTPWNPSNSNAPVDIVALDKGMGAVLANNGQIQTGIITSTHRLFFTVTAANAAVLTGNTALMNNIVRMGLGNSDTQITGATIFVAEYTGPNYAGPSVQDVKIFRDYIETVPPVVNFAREDADIDALCIKQDPMANGVYPDPQYGLVSYVGMNYGEQIQAIYFNQPLNDRFAVLRDIADRAIWWVLQWLETTEVDGMCTEDPEGTVCPASFGAPLWDTVTSPRLGLSVHVDKVHNGGIPSASNESVKVTCTVSGWAGLANGVPSDVYLVVQHPNESVQSYMASDPRAGNDDTFTFAVELAWPIGKGSPSVLTVGQVEVGSGVWQVSWSSGVHRN